jgi:hypothetical protein
MPNHVHGIVFLAGVGARHASPLWTAGPTAGSLGAIIGSVKSASLASDRAPPVAAGVLRPRDPNEEELEATRRYILNNPLEWRLDPENPHLLEQPGVLGRS